MRKYERVSLWIRIKTPDGKRPYCPIVPKKDGWAMVNGKPEKHLEGVYHLRFEVNGKRYWENVGCDLRSAEAQQKIRDGELSLNKPVANQEPAKLTLVEQKARFLEQKQLTKKQDGSRLDTETLSAYEQQVSEFLSVLGKKTLYAEQIDGMDLRRYMEKLAERGLTHRTICNHYTSIATFLKFCGVDHKELLPLHERPRPDDGDPEAYTEEEMIKFLSSVSRERDRLAFEFLLKTGAREREMTCCLWTDITGGQYPAVKFQNHLELSFRTKTGKSRVVPLEKGLYLRLMMWKAKNPDSKRLFGTASDSEDTHYLETCKLMAYRAGLNCGKCDSCKEKNECEHWWLHKFRDTFATWALRAGTDIRTVQGWMGHASIEQTMRYCEKARAPLAQEKANVTFGINLGLDDFRENEQTIYEKPATTYEM